MFGLLNVDKPAGMTSRDVVNRVQRLVRPTKVGHAGTLDPLARGVLVLCLGRATRLIPYVQRMGKRYEAVFLLGRRSDTEDSEGQVELLEDPPRPSVAEIRDVLATMIGPIQQVPPAYSALKVDGQRAYALARAGETVELAARTVVIHELILRDYDYPRLELEIACGSGTYVRSLGRDIAAACGTAAVMSELVRSAVGSFRREAACSLAQLEAERPERWLLPARQAVADLPEIRIGEAELSRLRQGQPLRAESGEAIGEAAAVDTAGHLAAILRPTSNGQAWRPALNFVAG